MSEDEINKMRAALLLGKRLSWFDSGEAKEIEVIVRCIESSIEEDNEPGPCAMLVVGGWIALWNVEASSIFIIELLFT